MPGFHVNMDNHILLPCTAEMRQRLIAIAWFQDRQGYYTHIARDLLTRAVDDFYLDLDRRGQQKYDTLLEAVKADEEIRRQLREERKRARENDTLILDERLRRL